MKQNWDLPAGTSHGDPNAPWNAPEIVGVCHVCHEEIPIADEDGCITREWWKDKTEVVICPKCVENEIDLCELCGEQIELEVSKVCLCCNGTGEV